MADNTTVLGKEVLIGGSIHVRDSDIEERLAEGVVYIGDALAKGTAETQVIGATETGVNFKGIALGESIRPSDIATHSTVITDGKMMKYLKPSGGRYKVRVMFCGNDAATLVPSGAPVYFNGVGSTITANDSQLGDFYCDPACTDDAAIIGRLAAPVQLAATGTNTVNTEGEMWY